MDFGFKGDALRDLFTTNNEIDTTYFNRWVMDSSKGDPMKPVGT
jgi:hypothetical protein